VSEVTRQLSLHTSTVQYYRSLEGMHEDFGIINYMADSGDNVIE